MLIRSFSFVRFLTIWNALLLLFLFKLSSIALYSSPVKFPWTSFILVLTFCVLISLYFSTPSDVLLPFISSFLLPHMPSSSLVIQGVFSWRCLPRISLAASVTVVLNLLINVSVSSSSGTRGGNCPPCLECFCNYSVFQLLKVELNKGPAVITSYVCIWEAPRPCNVGARSESFFFYQDSRSGCDVQRVLCPSAGCFVWA